jgi:hypothetical protein
LRLIAGYWGRNIDVLHEQHLVFHYYLLDNTPTGSAHVDAGPDIIPANSRPDEAQLSINGSGAATEMPACSSTNVRVANTLAPEAGRLLRILLVWFSAVSANSRITLRLLRKFKLSPRP